MGECLTCKLYVLEPSAGGTDFVQIELQRTAVDPLLKEVLIFVLNPYEERTGSAHVKGHAFGTLQPLCTLVMLQMAFHV